MIKFFFLLLALCSTQDENLRQKPHGLSDAFMAYQMYKGDKAPQSTSTAGKGAKEQQTQSMTPPQIPSFHSHHPQPSMNPYMMDAMGFDLSDMLPMMMMRNQMAMGKQNHGGMGNSGGFGGGFSNPFMWDYMGDNPAAAMMMFGGNRGYGGRQTGRQAGAQITDAGILNFLKNFNTTGMGAAVINGMKNTGAAGASITTPQQNGPFGGMNPMLLDLSPEDLLMMKMMNGGKSNQAGAGFYGGAAASSAGGLSNFQTMMLLGEGLSDAMKMQMMMHNNHGAQGAAAGAGLGGAGGLTNMQKLMFLGGELSDAMKMQMMMGQHGARKQANPNATAADANSTAAANSTKPATTAQNGSGGFDPSIFNGMEPKDFLAYQALNGKLNPQILSQLIMGEAQEFGAANSMMPNGATSHNPFSSSPFAGATGAVGDLMKDAANLAAFEQAGITNPKMMAEAFEGQYLQTKTFSDLVKKGVSPVIAADLSKSKIQQYQTLNGMQKPGVANPWVMREIVDGEFLKYLVVDALVKAGLGRAHAQTMSENKQLQFQVLNNMVKQGQIDPSVWGTIMEGEFMKMKQKQMRADLINAALANHGLPTSTAGGTTAVTPRKSIAETMAAMKYFQQMQQTNAQAAGGAAAGKLNPALLYNMMSDFSPKDLAQMRFYQQLQNGQAGASGTASPLAHPELLYGMTDFSAKDMANFRLYQKMKQAAAASGAHSPNPMLYGMTDFGPQEMAEMQMYSNMMKHAGATGAGTATAAGIGASAAGGLNAWNNPMNPLFSSLDSSDLWMLKMMQNGGMPTTQQHGRAQSWMGSPAAAAGSGSMMNNLLLAEAMSDLNPMEMAMFMRGLNTGAGSSARMAKNFLPGMMGMGMSPQMMGMGMPMGGMGMGGMGGMGMGGMGGNPMQSMMMMDALNGGDLMGNMGNNDLMKDFGSMMMMKSMMQPQMMNPGMMAGGMSPYYGQQAHVAYQYPQAVVPTTAATTSASSGGFGSRLPGAKRGSIYDNYWEMSVMNNLMNNQGGAQTANSGATGAGTPSANQNQQLDLQNLAAWEMAVGDAQPATGTGASSTPAVNEVVVEKATQ